VQSTLSLAVELVGRQELGLYKPNIKGVALLYNYPPHLHLPSLMQNLSMQKLDYYKLIKKEKNKNTWIKNARLTPSSNG
jgi:hypothetical protein